MTSASDTTDGLPKQRRLKVYCSLFYMPAEITDAIGVPAYRRQAEVVVAAESKRQAGALLGVAPADFRHILNDDHELSVIALASPGQLFASNPSKHSTAPPVKIGRAIDMRQVELGVVTDLVMARHLLEQEQRLKDQRGIRRVAHARAAQEATRQRNSSIEDARDVIAAKAPKVAAMGFTLSQVRLGESSRNTDRNGDRTVGVLVPAEMYAELVDRAGRADH